MIDKAFAALTFEELRLDSAVRDETAGPDEEPSTTERRVAPELVNSLRSQLEAIEAQQRTLQRLLNDLEG